MSGGLREIGPLLPIIPFMSSPWCPLPPHYPHHGSVLPLFTPCIGSPGGQFHIITPFMKVPWGPLPLSWAVWADMGPWSIGPLGTQFYCSL